MTVLRQGKVLLESTSARVIAEQCFGCCICLEICPYQAISFDEELKQARVDETMCRGCGTCVAACPSAAIVGRHFTDEQIASEIEGLMLKLGA
jgi:heterodisulfide reductase subunit A